MELVEKITELEKRIERLENLMVFKEKKCEKSVIRHKYGAYGWVLLSLTEFSKLGEDYGEETVDEYIKIVDEYAQSTGNKQKYKDWNLVVRKAIKNKWGISNDVKIAKKACNSNNLACEERVKHDYDNLF